MKNKYALVIAVALLLLRLHTAQTIPSSNLLPVDGLRVLIIEDTSERGKDDYPTTLVSAVFSVKTRRYIESKGGKFAVIDSRTEQPADIPIEWATGLKLPRDGTPWLIVSGSKKQISEKLSPKTDTDSLVKKLQGAIE